MTIIIAIVAYVIVGIIVGIQDLVRLVQQDNYFQTIPRGDLEFHKRVPILGTHNWVFVTSWLVIKPFLR